MQVCKTVAFVGFDAMKVFITFLRVAGVVVSAPVKRFPLSQELRRRVSLSEEAPLVTYQ